MDRAGEIFVWTPWIISGDAGRRWGEAKGMLLVEGGPLPTPMFQSYQDDGRMIMKGFVQWNAG